MSSAGHILDMIRRMEQNRKWQKSLGGKFRDKSKYFKSVNNSQSEQNPNLKTFTPEEREGLRKPLFKEIKQERLTKNIYTFLIVSFLIFLMYMFLY